MLLGDGGSTHLRRKPAGESGAEGGEGVAASGIAFEGAGKEGSEGWVSVSNRAHVGTSALGNESSDLGGGGVFEAGPARGHLEEDHAHGVDAALLEGIAAAQVRVGEELRGLPALGFHCQGASAGRPGRDRDLGVQREGSDAEGPSLAVEKNVR